MMNSKTKNGQSMTSCFSFPLLFEGNTYPIGLGLFSLFDIRSTRLHCLAAVVSVGLVCSSCELIT